MFHETFLYVTDKAARQYKHAYFVFYREVVRQFIQVFVGIVYLLYLVDRTPLQGHQFQSGLSSSSDH